MWHADTRFVRYDVHVIEKYSNKIIGLNNTTFESSSNLIIMLYCQIDLRYLIKRLHFNNVKLISDI